MSLSHENVPIVSHCQGQGSMVKDPTFAFFEKKIWDPFFNETLSYDNYKQLGGNCVQHYT